MGEFLENSCLWIVWDYSPLLFVCGTVVVAIGFVLRTKVEKPIGERRRKTGNIVVGFGVLFLLPALMAAIGLLVWLS